ncbi:hypothetical protein DENSPDRAFT_846493 [Dentipellis sp. KUC8613]|nr:hypothetical protein DENSPDRAFT_846493 [Dentipellis sp. KUC8613]
MLSPHRLPQSRQFRSCAEQSRMCLCRRAPRKSLAIQATHAQVLRVQERQIARGADEPWAGVCGSARAQAWGGSDLTGDWLPRGHGAARADNWDRGAAAFEVEQVVHVAGQDNSDMFRLPISVVLLPMLQPRGHSVMWSGHFLTYFEKRSRKYNISG